VAPTILWHRRDLRLADLPALRAALEGATSFVPLYVLDERLLRVSGPRTAFLLGCLRDLDTAYRALGSALVVRTGDPVEVVPRLAAELGARAVAWTSDVSPLALRRDLAARDVLRADGVEPRPQGGQYLTDVSRITTPDGDAFDVFARFGKLHRVAERRPVLPAPRELPPLPRGLTPGALPEAEQPLPQPHCAPGETAARAALDAWLAGGLDRYAERVNDMARVHVSGLSPYFRWGCLSVREAEQRARDSGSPGASSWCRQLVWRDFHAHVLLRRPWIVDTEHQPRFRGTLRFDDRPDRLEAWEQGRTGFPLVDAGMRHLAATGWMPNRVRLVVASFLVEDLHLDWRAGVRHFNRLLLCGEPAQNVGNWQWIAGTGTDPQPAYRRLYNPELHRRRLDPDFAYVRRWVAEFDSLDYPRPIVDHLAERRVALDRYREAVAGEPGAVPE
jgi:deoxyribodipyrimidine photo-lyase